MLGAADTYRKDIQSLRAISVLSVILFHYYPPILPGGFVGVDIFFFISGLLLAGQVTKLLDSGLSKRKVLVKYAWRRMQRIVPAYVIMLVIVAIASSILLTRQDFTLFSRTLEKAFIFSSNIYFSKFNDYFSPESSELPLLHTWSIAVEIQLYLLVPLILFSLKATQRIPALVILTCLALIYSEYLISALLDSQSAYYGTLTRAPAFLIGCAVSAVKYEIPTSWRKETWISAFALALLIVSVIYQPILGEHPGVSSLIPIVAVTILLMFPASKSTNAVLGSRVLEKIGGYSYSLYLWHWPILALLRYYEGDSVLSISSTLIFLALTIILSILSYRFIEIKYWNNSAASLGRIALLVIAVVLGLYLAKNIFITASDSILSPSDRRYADPNKICHGYIVEPCAKGDVTGNQAALVVGDSHAAMLNNLFENVGLRNKIHFKVITASSCLTIPGFQLQESSPIIRQRCQAQIEYAKNEIKPGMPIILAGYWNWHFKNEGFPDSLESFLLEYSLRHRILILGQLPMLQVDPMRHARYNSIGLPSNQKIYNGYQIENEKLKDLAGRIENVEYMPLDRIFLKLYGIDDIASYYFDRHHLNEKGVERYSKIFDDQQLFQLISINKE